MSLFYDVIDDLVDRLYDPAFVSSDLYQNAFEVFFFFKAFEVVHYLIWEHDFY